MTTEITTNKFTEGDNGLMEEKTKGRRFQVGNFLLNQKTHPGGTIDLYVRKWDLNGTAYWELAKGVSFRSPDFGLFETLLTLELK